MEYKLIRIKVHGMLVTEDIDGNEKFVDVHPVEVDRWCKTDLDNSTLDGHETVVGFIPNPNLFHVYAKIEPDGFEQWVSLGYHCPEDDYDYEWDKIAEEEIARYIKRQAKGKPEVSLC
ncbi:MAG: hypothetical protein A4E59_00378 [Syntrophorhabdus sp. PtaB.Bin027]|nr:MAG: hypothetical protein A4E59_00378 [Syntrophorhabdus sp. PtaB.Bin027]